MQFYQVQFRAVTFVLAKAIFRETRAEVAHNRVARDLGDDARGRDREAVAIAVDDRGLREREREHRQTVDEDVLRLRGEAGEGGVHRLVGRAQNVDRVDFDGIDDADRPRDRGVRQEIAVNFLALLRQQLLRIVQLPVFEFLRKNNRGRDHRTGKRAATGFIDPGDRGNPERAQFAFMPEATAPIHRRKILETWKTETLKLLQRLVLLADGGRFLALAVPQVIQLRAARAARFFDFHLGDAR
jgi:hypothetical protein